MENIYNIYVIRLQYFTRFYAMYQRYRRVRQGELQNTGTTSNTTVSIICTRVTVGANIVRPQTVRFYAIWEHTVLPYGIIVADEAAPECPALR